MIRGEKIRQHKSIYLYVITICKTAPRLNTKGVVQGGTRAAVLSKYYQSLNYDRDRAERLKTRSNLELWRPLMLPRYQTGFL